MEGKEKDDPELSKALTGLLTDLKVLLKRIQWKISDNGYALVHRVVPERDPECIFAAEPGFRCFILGSQLGRLLPCNTPAHFNSLVRQTGGANPKTSSV